MKIGYLLAGAASLPYSNGLRRPSSGITFQAGEAFFPRGGSDKVPAASDKSALGSASSSSGGSTAAPKVDASRSSPSSAAAKTPSVAAASAPVHVVNKPAAKVSTPTAKAASVSTTPPSNKFNKATTTSTSTSKTVKSATKKSKWNNLQERAGPALMLLVGLHLIIRFGQEPGMQCLTIMLSPAMFQEAVSVTGARPGALEWSWFFSYGLLSVLPAALPVHANDLRLSGYIGLVLTLMGTIYRLNASSASAEPAQAAKDFKESVSDLAKSHVCMAVTILPCACWVAILGNYSQEWVLYALFLVILNDTMAYVFGMTMGKHALLPTISPKKTVEGYIGAWVSTMLLSRTVWRLLFNDAYGRHGLLISLFCNTLAPFGGFVASVVKRAYGKKDFGSFIQGHGGFIDRLDCQLLTAPFLYLYLRAMGVDGGAAAAAAAGGVPGLEAN